MPAVLPAFFLAIADSKLYERKPIMAEVLHKRGDAAVQLVPNSLAQTKCMLAPMNNPPDTSRWVRGFPYWSLIFHHVKEKQMATAAKKSAAKKSAAKKAASKKPAAKKAAPKKPAAKT